MAQFKCVAGPGAPVLKSFSQLQNAVDEYGEIISKEAVGGWELYGIYPIQLANATGIVGAMGLHGKADFKHELTHLNMLVFKKQ